MPSILIVEDHQDFRLALKHFLEANCTGGHIIEATTGEEAVVLAKQTKPGVILMDFALGEGMNGMEAASQIKAFLPACAIIMLTVYDPKELQMRANKDHIKEIISKSDLFEKLIPSINKVLYI